MGLYPYGSFAIIVFSVIITWISSSVVPIGEKNNIGISYCIRANSETTIDTANDCGIILSRPIKHK